jgi:YD repeat-containing protein
VHVTTYTLDKLGRTTQVTDPEGMETTYDYDVLGRKTEEIRDAAQGGLQIKTTWKYDQWDGVDEVFYDVIEAWEDAQNHQDTEYYYGAAKHPTAVTKTVYPDSGAVTVAYNDDREPGGSMQFGRSQTAVRGGASAPTRHQRDWETAYTYDDAGRVTQESVTGNGLVGTDTVSYSYDALGRPTQVTDNGDPNDANDNSTVDWTYTREGDGDLKVEETQKYGNMTDRTVITTYDDAPVVAARGCTQRHLIIGFSSSSLDYGCASLVCTAILRRRAKRGSVCSTGALACGRQAACRRLGRMLCILQDCGLVHPPGGPQPLSRSRQRRPQPGAAEPHGLSWAEHATGYTVRGTFECPRAARSILDFAGLVRIMAHGNAMGRKVEV